MALSLVLAFALMTGLIAEVRVPAGGYRCLAVQSRGPLFLAKKLERSRWSERTWLTMPSWDVLGFEEKTKGRVIEIDGYRWVTDSVTCECGPNCINR